MVVVALRYVQAGNLPFMYPQTSVSGAPPVSMFNHGDSVVPSMEEPTLQTNIDLT